MSKRHVLVEDEEAGKQSVSQNKTEKTGQGVESVFLFFRHECRVDFIAEEGAAI